MSGSTNGTVKIWDLSAFDKKSETDLSPHTNTISSLAALQNSEYVVSVSEDGSAAVWNSHTQNLIWRFSFASGGMARPVVIAVDETSFLITTPSGCRVYNLVTRDIDYQLAMLAPWVPEALSVSPDGKYLMGSSPTRHTAVWPIPKMGKSLWLKFLENPKGIIRFLVDFLSSFRYRREASKGYGFRNRISSNSYKQVFPIHAGLYGFRHSSSGYIELLDAISFIPNSSIAVFAVNLGFAGGMNSCSLGIRIVHLRTLKVSYSLYSSSLQKRLDAAVRLADKHKYDYDADQLLDQTVKDYSELRQNNSLHEPIYALAVTLDGKYAVVGNEVGDVVYWLLQPNSECCILSKGGQQDTTCKFIRNDYKNVVMINAHSDKITGITILPRTSGYQFITISLDCTIKLWDLKIQQPLASFTGDNPLFSCEITPDGETVVVGDSAGQMYFLSIENLEKIDFLSPTS